MVMNKNYLGSFILFLMLTLLPFKLVALEHFRIGFGSCNKTNLDQPLWDIIGSEVTDLSYWIWGGDAVYGSHLENLNMEKLFLEQKNHPSYQKFLQKKIPINGVWDDHDYGVNDGDYNHPHRDEVQKYYLDFIDEPEGSPRRKQKGIYTSLTLTTPLRVTLNKEVVPFTIKILLLDIRSFKQNSLITSDLLGVEQWKWLSEELTNSKAHAHLLVSGIQFLSDHHRFEKWNNFPKARQKLFKLIKDSHAKGVIMLSGDRHFAEISRMVNNKELAYPLYDITASGLTHTYTPLIYEYNPYRVGRLYKEIHFGVVEFKQREKTSEKSLEFEIDVSLEIRDRFNSQPILVQFPLKEIL
jgi:alkaline phosphatase D